MGLVLCKTLNSRFLEIMSGYSLSKFQKMTRPKTAGERNEQLMMDKVGNSLSNTFSHEDLIALGEKAAGEDPGPSGEAPVLLSVQRSKWNFGTWKVKGKIKVFPVVFTFI